VPNFGTPFAAGHNLANPLAADWALVGEGGGRRDKGERGAQQHGSPPQRDHRAAFACADEGRDVVAHARERIAATGPSIILVVARDQVGADVADSEFGPDFLGDAVRDISGRAATKRMRLVSSGSYAIARS
jgi:hypothetical protein